MYTLSHYLGTDKSVYDIQLGNKKCPPRSAGLEMTFKFILDKIEAPVTVALLCFVTVEDVEKSEPLSPFTFLLQLLLSLVQGVLRLFTIPSGKFYRYLGYPSYSTWLTSSSLMCFCLGIVLQELC